MKSKFLFSLGLVFTMIMSPAFANNQYISAAPASSIYDASVPNAFDVKNLDSMDYKIIVSSKNKGCIVEESIAGAPDYIQGLTSYMETTRKNNQTGNYTYIECAAGGDLFEANIYPGNGAIKLSDRDFTVVTYRCEREVDTDDDGTPDTTEYCGGHHNIKRPLAFQGDSIDYVKELDILECPGYDVINKASIVDEARDKLDNPDTGYYLKNMGPYSWWIYQGSTINDGNDGVNKIIRDELPNTNNLPEGVTIAQLPQPYRKLFVPNKGDGLWLVGFCNVDLYQEDNTGKTLVSNRATKYRAGAVYGDGPNAHENVIVQAIKANSAEYFSVVDTFMIGIGHGICRYPGCGRNVATSGSIVGNTERYSSYYCEDHACGCCWMAANAIYTYSYNKGYSYERLRCMESNVSALNEPWMLGVDNDNIDIRFRIYVELNPSILSSAGLNDYDDLLVPDNQEAFRWMIAKWFVDEYDNEFEKNFKDFVEDRFGSISSSANANGTARYRAELLGNYSNFDDFFDALGEYEKRNLYRELVIEWINRYLAGQHEFCASHRCDACEDPIIGRNLGDAKFEEPAVYEGRYREMYSNYCESHFCEHFLCNKSRVSTDRADPVFDFFTGRRTLYPGYCRDHSSDCGNVTYNPEYNVLVEWGCNVYDDSYTLYRRPLCLVTIMNYLAFEENTYRIARNDKGKIIYKNEWETKCVVCGESDLVVAHHYRNSNDKYCSTCFEFSNRYFEPDNANTTDTRPRELLTDKEVVKTGAHNPMHNKLELHDYKDILTRVDSNGQQISNIRYSQLTTIGGLTKKHCDACSDETLWVSIGEREVCKECYSDSARRLMKYCNTCRKETVWNYSNGGIRCMEH